MLSHFTAVAYESVDGATEVLYSCEPRESKSPTRSLHPGLLVIGRIVDWAPRRAITVELELPAEVADEIERLQHHDPDLLERMLGYAAVRAACFEGIRDGIGTQRSHTNT
jgi:hypothetical protein